MAGIYAGLFGVTAEAKVLKGELCYRLTVDTATIPILNQILLGGLKSPVWIRAGNLDFEVE